MRGVYYSNEATVKIISLNNIWAGNTASIGLVKLCDGQSHPFGVVSMVRWSDNLERIRFSAFAQEDGPGVGLPGLGFYATLKEARMAYNGLIAYCEEA